MRNLRTLLLLLLCLALPVYGGVTALPDEAPCGMHTLDAAAGLDDLADCCDDAVEHAGGGEHSDKPCKSGPDCKAGSSLLPAAWSGRHAVPRAEELVARRAAPPPTSGPADIWRPPAAS